MVFDGATGTMLYERGIFLNKCFDELCLSRPSLVADVHRAYIDVGADVIQTNSYGANRIALARHGLEKKSIEICKASLKIAREVSHNRTYVAGSIGPTGLLPKDLMRSKTRHQVLEAFREQAEALRGADLLLFETFGYLGELELAIEAAYDVKIPIAALASFNEQSLTLDGAGPSETIERLKALGVDIMGANCILGPEKILDVTQDFIKAGAPLVFMQPNAGYPRSVDGRSIYQSSPETFGVCSRRAFKLGVNAIGGCCGTVPDHIRRVVASARMLGGGRWRNKEKSDVKISHKEEGKKPILLEERSRLGKKIANQEWMVSVEMLPPNGLDPTKVIQKIQTLANAGVDVVNIPDGPRAMVRMNNIALAKLILEQTSMEPLVHFCARDRNILGLQGDLLGASVLGIRNLVVITGDPPKVGDYPDATAVFDLDSIGLLNMASGLNRSIDPAGKSTDAQTSFVLASGAEPGALDFDREIRRLFEKRDAGAEVIMTQPVFDPAILDRFLEATKDLNLPIMVGIIPLASSKNANFLHKNVPGMQIPENVRKRLAQAGSGAEERDEGIRIAAEALRTFKDQVQGVYLMPPFGRIESALQVLKQADL